MVPFTHIQCSDIQLRNKIVIFICKRCLRTAKRSNKNQRTVYEYVNILFNQVYEKVIFFEDKVYDWGRFKKKIGSHTVQTLPQVIPPPPPRVISLCLCYSQTTNKGFLTSRPITYA